MRYPSWLRVALAALVLITTPLTLSAQAGSQERAIFVSALDDKGLPVEGLGVDAFAVRENGIQREILRVSRATEPIDITLLIDNSSAASQEVSFFRKALPEFIARIVPGNGDPGNRMALVGLANRPTVLTPSTSDVKRLTSRVESLFSLPESGATLLDAIVETSEGLMKRDAPRAAIIAIVTDGPEFTNRYAKDVIATLKKAQAALHLVTIGQFLDNTPHELRERVFLISDGPKATGGSHASMLVANGLAPHLDRLAHELTSQYKVVYARPDALIAPDTIEVTAARAGLTVRGTPARSAKGA